MINNCNTSWTSTDEQTICDLTTDTGSTVTTSTLRGPGDKTSLGVNETAADAAGSRGPSKANPVPADEFKKLLIQCFPANAKVHRFYSCQADKCVTLSKEDQQQMKGKDRFQHQWISDNSLSYCEKTRYHWLLFQEGKGMFCIICRKHDTINPQNKSKKFNTEPLAAFSSRGGWASEQGIGVSASGQLQGASQRKCLLQCLPQSLLGSKGRTCKL